MDNFHRYFFIMPTLARFELAIHERVEQGKAADRRRDDQAAGRPVREGYGDEVEMDGERIGITLGAVPDPPVLNFYVYQYATGISAAHALGPAGAGRRARRGRART